MAEFEKLITLTQISDGAPGEPGASADQYRIEFSQEEILKFVKSVDDKGAPSDYSYSSSALDIWIYKNEELTMNFELEVLAQTTVLTENNLLVKDPDTNKFTFKVQQYLDSEQGSAHRNEPSFAFIFKIKEEIKEINNQTGEEEVVRVEYKATKPIICRNGLEGDMATFNVHASGINAAIQSSALSFDTTGLTIQNGGLVILKTTEQGSEQVFGADQQGNLAITGKITALDGEIGGFRIEKNRLYSTKVDTSGNPLIELRGIDGKIITRDIELGEGAVIQKYMKFPQANDSSKAAYIYNPSTNDVEENLWLQAEGVSIYADGKIKLGTIELNSGTGNSDAYIKSANGNWVISESGRADFRDIYADNCHFRNTILETTSIQSAGNLMIFAESWIIESASDDGLTITLDKKPELVENEIIYINQQYYKVAAVLEQRVTLETAGNFTKGDIVTKIGKENDLIFSIFGQSNAGLVDKSYTFAYGNCLTLASLDSMNDNIGTFSARLVLGNLDSMKKEGVSGIGLYADNVFLEGSLTTQVKSDSGNSFAGINTLSQANALVFDEDNSKIVFWAGAEKNTAEAIQKAPFQVTERGSIYAQNGIFKDSIISDSVIQGADIYAARIHGGTQEDSAALTIYDSSQGIRFKNDYEGIDGTGQIVDGGDELLINISYMAKNGISFIDFSSPEPNFIGSYITLKTNESTSATILTDSALLINAKTNENIIQKGNLNFTKTTSTGTEFLFDFMIGSEEVAEFKQDSIELQTEQVKMSKNVQFGQNVYLQYRQVEKGYDLYVRSEISQEVTG